MSNYFDYPLSYNLKPTINTTYYNEYKAPTKYYKTQNFNNEMDINNYFGNFENANNTISYTPTNNSHIYRSLSLGNNNNDILLKKGLYSDLNNNNNYENTTYNTAINTKGQDFANSITNYGGSTYNHYNYVKNLINNDELYLDSNSNQLLDETSYNTEDFNSTNNYDNIIYQTKGEISNPFYNTTYYDTNNYNSNNYGITKYNLNQKNKNNERLFKNITHPSTNKQFTAKTNQKILVTNSYLNQNSGIPVVKTIGNDIDLTNQSQIYKKNEINILPQNIMNENKILIEQPHDNTKKKNNIKPQNFTQNNNLINTQNNESNQNLENSNINIAKPTPIKKRPLNKSDIINIIYKDIGIINLGNTCFINSCLQLLIHCPNFIYKFFEKMKLINKKETPISYLFYRICVAIMNTVNTQEKYIDISDFKNEFGLKHQAFGGYSPNDSQEFCRVFLEDISTELNEVKNIAVYREYADNEKKSKIIRDQEFDKNFKEREKSLIIDIFYSQIIATFTCECSSKFYSFQKILDFPLLLPENVPEIDIMELLKSYFKPETIEFERKCEKCQKILKHKKEIKISRPPEILILSLQRIDHVTQNKNECLVKFPQELDINEFIDHECGFDKVTSYSLYGIINHTGSIDFGHYYSYIKFHKKEEWYEFNDSSVRKIENAIESFPYAYALFYVRKESP